MSRPAPDPLVTEGPRSASRPAPGARLASVDALRGAAVAGMILVNNPGTWSAVYPPLLHAEWSGWTYTDTIFPFFLFVSGAAMALSFARRREDGSSRGALLRHLAARAAILVLLGLALNAVGAVAFQREHVRFPGILQRIGVCALAAGAVWILAGARGAAWAAALLLAGYWALLGTGPLDPRSNLAAQVDRAVFGVHTWKAGFDPEGLLSTLPAIGTCLLGVLAGRWLARPEPLAERLNGLFAVGALGMVAGLMWNWVFPINKNLWTSSYVLFTAGMAAVAIATGAWLIELRGYRRWAAPLITYGLNPITAFVGSGMMARVLGLLRVPFGGEQVSLQQAIYRGAFASWLSPRNASLGFAIAFVLLWYGILRLLERKGILLKV